MLPPAPLCSTPRLHGFVRECVCGQLRKHREWYEGYVLDASFEHYCAEMAKPDTWCACRRAGAPLHATLARRPLTPLLALPLPLPLGAGATT